MVTHGDEEASGYGLTNVYYDLDKEKYALYNADSYVLSRYSRLRARMLRDIRYAWYLTEVFWSIQCGKTFAAPE